MRSLTTFATIALLTAGGFLLSRRRGAEADTPAPPVRSPWAGFELGEIADRLAGQDGPWLEFLRTDSLRAGLYVLPAGGTDPQTPHTEDEVYHVVRGRAVLAVDGEDHAVGPGSVVYVAAGVDHRFHSIAEELEVLVLFARRQR
jgi:mannose-6-phosphate isomerase-like protein (cupin superfamily)